MSTVERRRLERAMRLLGIDPATADVLSRADAVWLMRMLPDEPEAAAAPGDEAGDEKTAPSDARSSMAPPSSQAADPDPAKATATDASRAGAGTTTSLFVQQPGAGDEDQLQARRIPVPAADALPGRAGIERALRPFLRRRPSRTRRMVDAEATAEASAQASANALLAAGTGRAAPALVPVLRAVPERWFDIVLLAEQDDTMRVFDDTLRELRQLLARHGAFRRVGLWRWSVRDGHLQMKTSSGMPCAPYAMLQGQHPQLVWVLTHGASTQWSDGPLRDFVRHLARRAVVAIVQLLPEMSWGATVLGSARTEVRSRERAADNSRLLRRDPWTGAWPHDGGASTAPSSGDATPRTRPRDLAADAVPMLSLRDDAVARWAEFVMAPRALAHAAVDIRRPPAARRQAVARPAVAADPHAQIRDRVLRFRAIASPQAFALLRLLSGAWITLPVMRLLLQSMPGTRSLAPMAEVLLSGLLRRLPGTGARVEEQTFDFQPEVREWLAGSLSSDERHALDTAMADSRQAIRCFVESRLNRTFSSFSALLLDPEGTELLPASARSFVEVSRLLHGLRRLPASGPGASAGPVAPATSAEPAAPPRGRAVRHVRVLHLANVYIGRDDAPADWRHRPALGRAWNDNLKEIALERPVDIVCLTGDVTMSALAEEYAEAADFLHELMDALQLPMTRLFCVPGNHDVNRRTHAPRFDSLFSSGHDARAEALRDPKRVAAMLERQAGFRRLQAGTGATPSGADLDYLARVELGSGDALDIVGLDSAWLAGVDIEDTLDLGDLQSAHLAAHPRDRNATIALMHHPMARMTAGRDLESLFAARGIALLLNGHPHTTDNAHWTRPSDRMLAASTGNLYDEPEVQVIDLELHPGIDGQPDRLETVGIVTRAWSHASLEWLTTQRIDPRTESPRTPAWHRTAESDPAEYGAPIFVGRAAELVAMQDQLPTTQSGTPSAILLVGERRIGKTALVHEYARRYWWPQATASSSARDYADFVVFDSADLAAIPAEVDALGQLVASRLGIDGPPDVRWPRLQDEVRDRPRLLVFDDVDGDAMQFAVASVATLLGCAVIATTTRQRWHGPQWNVIRLERLPLADAVALVSAWNKARGGRALTNDVIMELAHVGDGLPGALQMAARLWQEGTPMDAIQGEVASWRRGLEAADSRDDAAAPSASEGAVVRRVFLSSSDPALDGHAAALHRELVDRGVLSIGRQVDRLSGESELVLMDTGIQASDAVVCLTLRDDGEAGPSDQAISAILERHPDLAKFNPNLGFAKTGLPHSMSYQHWASWLARYHDKPVFITVIPLDAAGDGSQPLHVDWQSAANLDRFPVNENVHVEQAGGRTFDEWIAHSNLMPLLPPRRDADHAANPPTVTHRARIFVAYAAVDTDAGRRLAADLRLHGYEARESREELVESQQPWEEQVAPWLQAADIVLACVSTNSEMEPGRFHEEIELATDMAEAHGELLTIIPVRFDRCKVPAAIGKLKRVDLFAKNGFEALLGFVADAQKRMANDDEGPPDAPRPSVFLSYAREDVKAVRTLAERLKTLGFAPIWFDVAEVLSVGESMASLVDNALRTCDYFMPVLSTHADHREGKFRDEWRAAIVRADSEREGFLLPVVIDSLKSTAKVYQRIFKDETARFNEVQWLHAPSGEIDESLASRLVGLRESARNAS